jgi:hypothetical protein
MIEYLLYSSILCTDADAIVLRIKSHEHMSTKVKLELVETIQEATPECFWDAND